MVAETSFVFSVRRPMTSKSKATAVMAQIGPWRIAFLLVAARRESGYTLAHDEPE
jgi:hypothetical protein